MSRIRSVHPGLFTDEAFMTASPMARILMIGIWTEAWDDGVFEWKPVVLKARIFPADACNVSELLDELASLNIVKRVERAGKLYGLIRNFRKFQRPKKPNQSGIATAQDVDFLGPEHASSLPISAPVPNQSRTGAEIPPQMEDEGGSKEEKKERSLRSCAVADAPRTEKPKSRFDEFWKEYPRRDGSNPKDPAQKKFDALCKSGVDPQAIIDGARAYAASETKRNNIGTPYIAQAITWLGQRRWKDDHAIQPPPTGQPAAIQQVFVIEGTTAWDEWCANYASRGKGYPPCKESRDHGFKRGWWFPTEHPPQINTKPERAA